MTTTPGAVTRLEKLAVVALVAALALRWNGNFAAFCTLPRILEMNDVAGILAGYRATPHLLSDGLQWWHGSMMQVGIPAFRPLTSYLYWIQTWVGLHWGFTWVAWFGYGMLVITCLLSVALAWRLTGSRLCALLAAVLAPAISYFNYQPSYWLAWYPMHYDIIMSALLMGALLCFDLWHERAETRYLVWSWVLFVAGCLTKEHVYIFPVFALAVVAFRRSNSTVARQSALLQAGLMLMVAVALCYYRSVVIVDPRTPTLKAVHLIKKPFLYLYFPFYKPVLSGLYWFPGLALLLFLLGGALIRLRRSERAEWLQKPFAAVGIAFVTGAIVCIYLMLTAPSLPEAFWYLFEPDMQLKAVGELLAMIFTLYTIHLLWKYRNQEPTLATWSFFVLPYVPVVSYLGWHYTIMGWFLRCVYWPVVAKLVWIDLGRPFADVLAWTPTDGPRSNRMLARFHTWRQERRLSQG